MGEEPVDFCREIETYLCKKNDGHLIRVVGPSFDLVAGWAARGVPLRIAFAGIDRYFERYYRNGPRRRPVRIDFCEADVLDVFDEWRRATGISRDPESRGESLPRHLERALAKLTAAQVKGISGVDVFIDRASAELDHVRAKTGGIRGPERSAVVERLNEIDADMLRAARGWLDQAALAGVEREAQEELAPFRGGMAPEAFARAREAAIDRLIRDRFGLPTVAFEA